MNHLFEEKGIFWKVYVRQNGRWVSEGLTRDVSTGIPASVKRDGAGRLKLRSCSEMVQKEQVEHGTFWDLLEEWGGDWMWEHIPDDVKRQDFSWLEMAMKEGTLVWCADGSYKRKVDPDEKG